MESLIVNTVLLLAVQAKCETYDYIIVGGGTCGLLLANRLSQDSSVTVAVLEPGDDTRNNTNVTIPTSWLNNLGSSIDWQYPSVVQNDAGNRSFAFNAGKAIGGTSTINGMMSDVVIWTSTRQ
jgi:choline dehydrogenase